jgi:hypothetical protein
VYENLAGYRGLAIEAMLGCWLALAIWTLALISRRLASPVLRLSFLTGLAAAALVAVSIFLAIIYACLMPFDFMLIRVDQPPVLHMVLHAIVLAELLAASFFLVRAVKGHPREARSRCLAAHNRQRLLRCDMGAALRFPRGGSSWEESGSPSASSPLSEVWP